MKLPRRQFLRLGAGAAALPAIGRVACAETYPTRPIRLVVPFPPGGAFDTLARPWVEQVKPLLGTMIVENIGGGGSSLGAAAVARARPDGYTILLGGTLPHVNEALLKSRPLYDPVKDLDPIAGLAVIALALAVHPSVPAQNLKEFVAYAKANAGKLSYGHPGVGSLNQLTGEMFKLLAGLPELAQVPYRGAGPVMADLISGQVVMGVVALTSQSLEFHRSGKLRILAVTSPERLIAAPRASDGGGGQLPRPDQSIDHRASRSGGNAEADHRADCAGGAHGACGTRLPAEANRFRFRSQSRHDTREIPASPRSRCCFLDAGGRGAWVEDRLTKARQSCSLREIS